MHYDILRPEIGMDFLKIAAERMYLNNLGVEPGEKIAIITDGTNDNIFDAIYSVAVKLYGGDCVRVIRIDGPENRTDGSRIFNEDALYGADVAVGFTNKSFTHSAEFVQFKQSGGRGVSGPRTEEADFYRAAFADTAMIMNLGLCVEDYLHNLDNNEITIVSGDKDNKYELTLYLDPIGIPFKDYGVYSERGHIGNWPFGEYAVLPQYGKGRGEMLFQFSSETTKPFLLELKNGKIVGWDENARQLVNLLSRYKNGLMAAEIGFGIDATMAGAHLYNPYFNPQNTVGNEKMPYTLHIGWGNNTQFGGYTFDEIHKDTIAYKPRLFSANGELDLWGCFDKILSPRQLFYPLKF